MEYKKGDRVKVKFDVNYHGFDIGSTVTILYRDVDDGGVTYRAISDNGLEKWIWHNELE